MRRYAIPSAHAAGTKATPSTEVLETPYAMRPCPQGCGRTHLLKDDEVCPWCSPPSQFGPPLAILVDAGGEDNPHPDRVADGSHVFNAGLPPIETSDGWRPVANAELGNNRGVREYAKRHGLEPISRGRYRGV